MTCAHAPDSVGAARADTPSDGFLAGLRVVEIADEHGEYTGALLARLGADVIKIEPAGGERTRGYGPFLDDVPDPNRSLHFWHFNLAKRSVVAELNHPGDRDAVKRLMASADVVIDARPRGHLAAVGLDEEAIRPLNARLVWARITPFGDTGPWADYLAGDLVHLALGGVMMNCGYSPDSFGRYDTPPIAPQPWQAYQIAGEAAAIGVLGALAWRNRSGRGQRVDTAVHDAVSKNTETDLPNWIYLRREHHRQTCRHSLPTGGPQIPALMTTKDGRYVLPYATYLPGVSDGWPELREMLARRSLDEDFDERFDDHAFRLSGRGRRQIYAATSAMVNAELSTTDLWQEAQRNGLTWAPLRRPEENVEDPHWVARGTFAEVAHPELRRSFTYIGARWVSHQAQWSTGPRPPLVDEHGPDVRAAEMHDGWRSARTPLAQPGDAMDEPVSPHGAPWALHGIRVIDLGWLLASAGAGRFLAGLGAEVIKVEHASKPDIMRGSVAGRCPAGGRGARDAATAPLEPEPSSSPNRGGAFMEINAGKYGLSLNLKTSRGRELLTDLLRDADVLIEGYSPGTLKRMGFGYDTLRTINPRLVYVQQSGMGEAGTYGQLRSFGPTAQAFCGLSELSGLPAPFPPAGIGYSYLDWFGAYNVATAVLAGLLRRDRTGGGCHIDTSQAEIGLYLTGASVLDATANRRTTKRVGNAPPWRATVLSGAYPTSGVDRWIAISCFDDSQWQRFAEVLDIERPCPPADLSELDRAELDGHIAQRTSAWDGWELMSELQQRGVPAGVCQTAADRCDADPQLAHRGWMTELPQTELGTWPVRALPFTMSVTPPHIGGVVGRSGPNYGEDTDELLGRLLGLSSNDLIELRRDGVL